MKLLFVLLLSGCSMIVDSTSGGPTPKLDAGAEPDRIEPANCLPDTFEPNETPGAAPLVEIPFLESLSLCEGEVDADVFRGISGDSLLTVSIVFTTETYPPYLEWVNNEGNPVVVGERVGDSMIIYDMYWPSGQEFFVQVRNIYENEIQYTIEVTAE